MTSAKAYLARRPDPSLDDDLERISRRGASLRSLRADLVGVASELVAGDLDQAAYDRITGRLMNASTRLMIDAPPR